MAESGASASATTERPARVLVVDDEVGLRQLCCAALELAGFVAVPAANAHGAETAWRDGAGLDAALIDLSLPDLSGAELALGWLREGTRLPILLMSGSSPEEVTEWAALRERGVMFLQKPFTLAQLEAVLREALRRAEPSEPGS